MPGSIMNRQGYVFKSWLYFLLAIFSTFLILEGSIL